jgi:transposase
MLRHWAEGADARLAQRACLVLALSEGASETETARRCRVSAQTVGKWYGRFEARRLDGLLDDPRPGAPRRISDSDIEHVLALMRSAPPGGAPRWTTRSLARETGLSQTAVSRIWRRHAEGAGREPAAGASRQDGPRSSTGAARRVVPGSAAAGQVKQALHTLARAAEAHPGGEPLRRMVEALGYASRSVAVSRGAAGLRATGDRLAQRVVELAEGAAEDGPRCGTSVATTDSEDIPGADPGRGTPRP